MIKIDLLGQLYKKQARDNQRLTLADVAEAIGENKQTLYNWRDGVPYPSLEVLDKLCDYFDCEVGDLLIREGKNTKQLVS